MSRACDPAPGVGAARHRARRAARQPVRTASADGAVPHRRMADTLRLAVWAGSLVVSLRLLHGAGHPVVQLGSWDDLRWATPFDLAGGVLHLAAIVLAWYLLVATALSVVADRTGWQGLARAARRITPRVVHTIAVRGSGVGLLLGTLTGGVLSSDAAGASPAAASLPPPAASTPAAPAPDGAVNWLRDFAP